MRFYRILLVKAYFEKGLSLTNYIKYIFAFAGIFDFIDGKTAVIFGTFYILFCYFLGRVWFKRGLIETENEINNLFNPFQKEVRDKLKVIRYNE